MKDMALRQVESLLVPWRKDLPEKPPRGWIRTIREGLGMPAIYLARKMVVEPSTIKRYEEAEASGAISIKTLQKIADALGCELKYALVPKESLSAIVENQAVQVVQDQINRVAHTMALEDQATSTKELSALIEEQAHALLTRSRRELWR